ncbi:unnamed protein product [Arabidopsis halleri]
MGIDSTRLGWMGVLRWKAWIRLGCPGDEQGVSVAHGHRHLAASNGNGGKHRIVRRAGVLESSSFTFCGCSWQPSFDGKWISEVSL